MLGASFIISLWSDPFAWAMVGLATLAEVIVDRTMLRWLQVDVRGLTARLVAVQLTTWFAVVTFVDCLMRNSKALTGLGLLALELMVVVAEVPLLRVVSRFPLQGRPASPFRLSTAAALSVVGNSASVGVIVGAIALLHGGGWSFAIAFAGFLMIAEIVNWTRAHRPPTA